MLARIRALFLALPLLCLSGLCRAQFKPAEAPPKSAPQAHDQTSQEKQPTFAVKVNLVRLLVSVRDQTGAVRTDLEKQDFLIKDSGTPQEIAVFERKTSLPLSVAVLIDTSGSTEKDLHYEEDSVLRFIPTLLDAGNPEDAFALFSFNMRLHNGDTDRHVVASVPGWQGGVNPAPVTPLQLAGTDAAPPDGQTLPMVFAHPGLYYLYCSLHASIQPTWHRAEALPDASERPIPMEAFVLVVPARESA